MRRPASLQRRDIGAAEHAQCPTPTPARRRKACTRNALASSQRLVGPAGRSSSVSPTIDGAQRQRRRARSSRRRRERQIATGPGHGSANTASARQHHRLARSTASADRAPAPAPARSPAAAPAAATRRGRAAASNTSGSIARAFTRARSVSTISRDFEQPPPSVDRERRSRRPASARAGSAAARIPRSRGRPTDPAARFRRAARPPRRWSPWRDRHARAASSAPTRRRDVAAARR